MTTNAVKKLARFINERDKVRRLKESDAPKPWTKDKMLLRYRFTNVHREDDKVTRWLAENWRNPHDGDPLMWHAMLIARFINRIDTLAEIGWPEPWSKRRSAVIKALRARRDRGDKVYGGAYIVSTNGVDMDKLEYSIELFDATAKETIDTRSLAAAWRSLMMLNAKGTTKSGNRGGVGTFMAAQIVADLKYTKTLIDAPDWWNWCAPGPGSLRGLGAVRGKPSKMFKHPSTFVLELNNLRIEIMPLLDKEIQNLCLQDLQNCLCEFSKYVRGYSRSTYPGEA